MTPRLWSARDSQMRIDRCIITLYIHVFIHCGRGRDSSFLGRGMHSFIALEEEIPHSSVEMGHSFIAVKEEIPHSTVELDVNSLR